MEEGRFWYYAIYLYLGTFAASKDIKCVTCVVGIITANLYKTLLIYTIPYCGNDHSFNGYERRVDFMKRILKGMAEAAKKTAKASVNSASFLSMY